MSFGDQLYGWRKAKGLTQQELAVAVGVNVSYISNLERDFSANTKSGKPRPSEALCEKFAKVLDVKLSAVREAAGYSALGDAPSYDIADRVQVKLGVPDLSPDEREEIAEELALAYEVIMARRRARQARNEQ